MTHQEIETFLSVVKCKSVSKAAESLYLTQSSVSHRLSTLEEELGVQLIIRRKGYRTIELTREGEMFVPIAYEWEKLQEKIISFTQRGSKLVFSIACHDSLNTYVFYKLMPRLLAASGQQQKGVTFRLESHNTDEILQLLESGHVNVGFLRNPTRSKNLIFQPFFSEEFKVITNAVSVYPECPINSNDLNPNKEIYVTCAWGNEFTRWHDTHLKNGSCSSISINAASTVPLYLVEPEHWAIVPVSIAEELKRKHDIRCLDMTNPPPPVCCYKVYLRSSPYATSEMMAFFKEELDTFMETMPYLKRLDSN